MFEGARSYIESWFWSLDQLARAVGVASDQLIHLVDAGCAPGPIYVEQPTGEWWSSIDEGPAPEGECWYSPASAWWLRRAVLKLRSGLSAAQISQFFELEFIEEFAGALAKTEFASLAFPACFVDGNIIAEAARQHGRLEWHSWTDGGYGVCLRSFTATTCVTKEALRAELCRALQVRDTCADILLKHAQALAGIILPFAPWQRSTCTPGVTIDGLLTELSLGEDLPYA